MKFQIIHFSHIHTNLVKTHSRPNLLKPVLRLNNCNTSYLATELKNNGESEGPLRLNLALYGTSTGISYSVE